MKCNNCDNKVTADQKFCTNCGFKLSKFCGTCGSIRQDDAKFCSECGGSQKDESESNAEPLENKQIIEKEKLTNNENSYFSEDDDVDGNADADVYGRMNEEFNRNRTKAEKDMQNINPKAAWPFAAK